jgi:hypothetical protein
MFGHAQAAMTDDQGLWHPISRIREEHLVVLEILDTRRPQMISWGLLLSGNRLFSRGE